MKSTQIRQSFLDFFENKQHAIVDSAPIVNHDDPSLMFINAGMNPFKDYFLGTKVPQHPRVADTQKCLRVSGKHNDLDEVGRDGYHHTMFEMLGNWSFGDYFKEEAIRWAWEFLTEVLKIDKDRLYVTIFEGDAEDGTELDKEAEEYWLTHIEKERILPFDKKDNFWEMGATGPCGPCSEIHIDLRDEEERKRLPAASLVNRDHPEVIEIWNLVFIQYNRRDTGELEELPSKHIDTGMGFERLAMVMQDKTSSYDTDVFAPYITRLTELTGHKYTYSYEADAQKDMAFRVLADHLRAIVFAISDGLLPSNTGAGYVIRRILRRAVRYSYSFLGIEEPILCKLVPTLIAYYRDTFTQLVEQEDFIARAIEEEEKSFLRTLSSGLKRLEEILEENSDISGRTAFELYDTYGFPIDLTRMIAEERGVKLDVAEFHAELEKQKSRARQDAEKTVQDWTVLSEKVETESLAHDHVELDEVHIVRYRSVKVKKKIVHHVVLDKTPFYAESGGQVGDTGVLKSADQTIHVLDTFKENDLIVHVVNAVPDAPEQSFTALVSADRRQSITRNHSATHLLHAALKEVLGDHVQQKGSLVEADYLRFDFSHFQKMTEEEIESVEAIVNSKIRENIKRQEQRDVPLEEARESGATMLFGEKYGEKVRIITFDPSYSQELCGGCHVDATGEIGWFKIRSESAIGSGVRRIEAVSAGHAEAFVHEKMETLEELSTLLKNPDKPVQAVEQLLAENKSLQKQLNAIAQNQVHALRQTLADSIDRVGPHRVIAQKIDLIDPAQGKNLVFQLTKKMPDVVVALGVAGQQKAQLFVGMDKQYAKDHELNASHMVREISQHIKGGGGGQDFFATAGGKNPAGIDKALESLKAMLSE